MIMFVFCKGCRQTKDNEGFGLKANGTQCKTCVKCRYKKLGVKVSFKKPEAEIIDCCDAEAIRNTFR